MSVTSPTCDSNGDISGTFQKLNDSVTLFVSFTPCVTGNLSLSVPITADDKNGHSQTTFMIINFEPIGNNLSCEPPQVILPTIPISRCVEIPLKLIINSSMGHFRLENIFFVTWKEWDSKNCPFLMEFPNGKGDFNSELLLIENNLILLVVFQQDNEFQKMSLLLKLESPVKCAISNRPQTPCLVFIVRSEETEINTVVPFVYSMDDSNFSLVHFNALSNEYAHKFTNIHFSRPGVSLLNYLTRFDMKLCDIVARWLRYYGFPGGFHGLNFPIDFER